MSLNFNPSAPVSAEEAAQAKSQAADDRAKIHQELRKAEMFHRLSVDEVFKEFFLSVWLGETYKELDALLDTCPPEQLASVRAQRLQTRMIKNSLETILSSSGAKIEELKKALEELPKDT